MEGGKRKEHERRREEIGRQKGEMRREPTLVMKRQRSERGGRRKGRRRQKGDKREGG